MIGSPWPDVLRMMYWAFEASGQAGAGSSASALRGSSKNAAGSPVASDRRPTRPAPKSVESSASRRETFIAGSFLHIPIETADGARHATTNVDWRAAVGVVPVCWSAAA